MSEEEGDDEVVEEIVEDGIKIVEGELVWEERLFEDGQDGKGG